MFNFSENLKEELLIEGRGEETAHSGFSNEHFTHQHLTEYVKHLGAGGSHETGIEKINRAKFNPAKIKPDHPLQNAVRAIGSEEVGKIHDDSKNTAIAIVNHLRNNYNLGVSGSHHVGKVGSAGEEEVRKLTGKPSNADVVVETVTPKKKKGFALAHIEHIGASLKYSKGAKGDVKIYAPSISHMAEIIEDHHEEMHGKRLGIQESIRAAANSGLAAQRAIVKKHAAALKRHFSSAEFTRNKDPKHVKKYLGKVSGAEDLEKGVLNAAGMSYIRNHPKLRAIYDEMASENLKMKQTIAGHLHRGITGVLGNQKAGTKGKNVQESLVRTMANIQRPEESDSLPTFLVSTERGKGSQIHDIHAHFQRHFDENGFGVHSYSKGASTLKVGPTNLTVDARPATTGNPLNNPINVSVSSSALKKGSENSKKKLNEMLLEAKANKAAAAFERMQSSSAVAQKNKQIQQSRENADSASKNQSYNRKSRDANIAARAVQKHSNQGQTQTFWRDEDGIPHVGGGEFAVNMAKAVNLSDRSPNLSEEAPANAMGTAGISGAQTAVDAGIAGYDLPIGMVRRKPPKMFAGKAVFTVPSSDFYNATLGKRKGKHYRSYVKGELGEEVRQYALENKNAPIILEDETTGAMMYLKYGKEK